eukprot:1159529-Pelagomonas_calceolata.AAC.9
MPASLARDPYKPQTKSVSVEVGRPRLFCWLVMPISPDEAGEQGYTDKRYVKSMLGTSCPPSLARSSVPYAIRPPPTPLRKTSPVQGGCKTSPTRLRMPCLCHSEHTASVTVTHAMPLPW